MTRQAMLITMAKDAGRWTRLSRYFFPAIPEWEWEWEVNLLIERPALLRRKELFMAGNFCFTTEGKNCVIGGDAGSPGEFETLSMFVYIFRRRLDHLMVSRYR